MVSVPCRVACSSWGLEVVIMFPPLLNVSSKEKTTAVVRQQPGPDNVKLWYDTNQLVSFQFLMSLRRISTTHPESHQTKKRWSRGSLWIPCRVAWSRWCCGYRAKICRSPWRLEGECRWCQARIAWGPSPSCLQKTRCRIRCPGILFGGLDQYTGQRNEISKFWAILVKIGFKCPKIAHFRHILRKISRIFLTSPFWFLFGGFTPLQGSSPLKINKGLIQKK